jgi:outer membrane protein OmpA-like peptidoglycan-associated protein
MKRCFASLFCALVLQLLTAPVPAADACGVKLTIKTPAPKKVVARSSNPSHMLLLGTPPRRLERELSDAGHDVEVAPNVGAAKRGSYAVVVTDPKEADEARAKFTGAVIVVRSGNISSDVASVESSISRKPIRTDEPRTVVAAARTRKPIAAGGGTPPNREIVAAKDTTPEPVEVKKPDPPKKVEPVKLEAKIETKVEPKVELPKTAPKPVAIKVPARAQREEVYFNLSSSNVAAKNAALVRTAKWLTDNPGVAVTVEGHADPTGSHDANLVLSRTRAESVRDTLVAAGVDASRIEVAAFGDTRLKYGATDGRNRRVAIVPKP